MRFPMRSALTEQNGHEQKEQLMEYISRDDALKSICEYCSEKGMCDDANVHCAEYADIKAIPAADVVPVVRCKDCLYGSENGFICGNVHGLQYAFPNAFCSNGTKRK